VILYIFPIAPNPTRVRLYIAEKRAGGAELDISEAVVNLPAGEQRASDHLARNPFGRLPVLEFDDGSHLTESLAIIEFLEELHPDPWMIGRSPHERARVREIERIAELGVLQPTARVVHATKSPLGLPPSPEIAAQARSLLPTALDYLERLLGDGRPFLAGENPTIADCTLAAGFQFGRFGSVELDPGYEKLHAWDRRFRERPAAESVLAL
jgi:glutathione S-transferase